jgi:membrane-associated HD superfamily phosphohydrolase
VQVFKIPMRKLHSKFCWIIINLTFFNRDDDWNKIILKHTGVYYFIPYAYDRQYKDKAEYLRMKLNRCLCLHPKIFRFILVLTVIIIRYYKHNRMQFVRFIMLVTFVHNIMLIITGYTKTLAFAKSSKLLSCYEHWFQGGEEECI